MKPAIFGLAGQCLSAEERAFFREVEPAGYILFGRNIADRVQVRALTDDLRAVTGRPDVPILIDQEGGRVSRLRPPVWPKLPAAERFAHLYRVAPISAIEAIRANGAAIATLLRELGISVNCAPLLDIRRAGASDVIGDRALGDEPMQVAALGRAMLEGLRDGGVVGVVKHMPGHGRASADSHAALPVVDASAAELESDIAPFRTLNWAPIGMTAHVLYGAWDSHNPATLSSMVIGEVIRGQIGFEGLLVSDDLGMAALTGGMEDRAERAIAAGCDLVLHCSGDLAEMEGVASSLGEIGAEAARRLDRAMTSAAAPASGASYADLAAKRDALLAYA